MYTNQFKTKQNKSNRIPENVKVFLRSALVPHQADLRNELPILRFTYVLPKVSYFTRKFLQIEFSLKLIILATARIVLEQNKFSKKVTSNRLEPSTL